jgi:hypothetical protein
MKVYLFHFNKRQLVSVINMSQVTSVHYHLIGLDNILHLLYMASAVPQVHSPQISQI